MNQFNDEFNINYHIKKIDELNNKISEIQNDLYEYKQQLIKEEIESKNFHLKKRNERLNNNPF